jgi:hypothetical protein
MAPLVGYEPFLEGNDIVYKYVKFQNEFIDITVGSFYEQYGSGLIFRSYEERAIGLNTSMDGVKLVFKPLPYLRLKSFWGKQRKYLDNGNGTTRGIDAELNLLKAFEPNNYNSTLLIGASWVNRYQPYTGVVEDFPKTVDAWATRLQFEREFFSIYSEFVEKSAEPNMANGNSNEIGNALLVSPSFNGNNIGLNINLRCVKNMEFRSEREAINQTSLLNYLPALTRQHKYALANLNPYGAQSKGEIGGQVDLFYRFKKNTLLGGKYGTKLSTNFSYYQNLGMRNDQFQEFLSFGNKKLFQDFNIELEKKISKKIKAIISYFNMEYNKGAIISGGDYLIKSNILVVDFQYKFSYKSVLRTELQHLWTKQDDKNWIYGLAEYSLAPHWSIFIADMYNYGSTNKHYLNLGFGYIKGLTRIMIQGGRHKEGLQCVGGICNRVEAYTGINLSITTSF